MSYKIRDININSWLACIFIDILKVLDKARHMKTRMMNMKKEYITMSENYKDNMRVIHPKFSKSIQQSSNYKIQSTQSNQTTTNNVAPSFQKLGI